MGRIALRGVVVAALTGLLLYSVAKYPWEAKRDSWAQDPPYSYDVHKPDAELAADAFVEIAASKVDAAQGYLERKPFVLADEWQRHFFLPPSFQCSSNTRPYLVRALFSTMSHGVFTIQRFGSTLYVSHDSIGRPAEIRRTALVVCLDFLPTEVFNGVSRAE